MINNKNFVKQCSRSISVNLARITRVHDQSMISLVFIPVPLTAYLSSRRQAGVGLTCKSGTTVRLSFAWLGASSTTRRQTGTAPDPGSANGSRHWPIPTQQYLKKPLRQTDFICRARECISGETLIFNSGST